MHVGYNTMNMYANGHSFYSRETDRISIHDTLCIMQFQNQSSFSQAFWKKPLDHPLTDI